MEPAQVLFVGLRNWYAGVEPAKIDSAEHARLCGSGVVPDPAIVFVVSEHFGNLPSARPGANAKLGANGFASGPLCVKGVADGDGIRGAGHP